MSDLAAHLREQHRQGGAGGRRRSRWRRRQAASRTLPCQERVPGLQALRARIRAGGAAGQAITRSRVLPAALVAAAAVGIPAEQEEDEHLWGKGTGAGSASLGRRWCAAMSGQQRPGCPAAHAAPRSAHPTPRLQHGEAAGAGAADHPAGPLEERQEVEGQQEAGLAGRGAEHVM